MVSCLRPSRKTFILSNFGLRFKILFDFSNRFLERIRFFKEEEDERKARRYFTKSINRTLFILSKTFEINYIRKPTIKSKTNKLHINWFHDCSVKKYSFLSPKKETNHHESIKVCVDGDLTYNFHLWNIWTTNVMIFP